MPIVLSPPGEREKVPLTVRLAALGRTRKWVAMAASLFALIGALLAVILVEGILDSWLHLGALPRAFALIAALTIAGIVWFRRVVPAFRSPTDPLSIALELEGRYPRMNDSLASAISFLDDERPGEDRGISNRLCHAAVRRAERMAERHDFGHLVPSGRCWRSFWLFGIALGLAGVFGLANPQRTGTVLERLADPFGSHPWPSKTRIELLLPTQFPARIPKGDVFELRFAVRGELPDRASVIFHVTGGEEFEDVYPLAPIDPANPGTLPPGMSVKGGPAAVVVTRLDPGRLAQNFQFRIRANDADTGWLKVDVLPPPRLVPLDGRASPQISVIPPAYTNLKPFELPDGVAVIEVPLGTVIALRAASDSRLASAALTFQGDRSLVERAAEFAHMGSLDALSALGSRQLADAIGADIPMILSTDGKVMQAVFTPSMSGMYALKMTDETGLNGSRLIEIRFATDPAPTLTLLRPSAGRDPGLVVPDAVIPIHIAADDKVYAIRSMVLEYRVGSDGPIREISLPDALAAIIGPSMRTHPARIETSFSLPVSAFRRNDGTPVRDGDTVFLRAAAIDWDDVSVLKESGRSGEFELRIASREAIEAILQKELAALRPELIRAREQQRDALQKTAEAKPQADGTLSPADREQLLGAEYAQRQVRGKVADPRDGLRAKAEMLRELARANKLPRSNATDRAEAAAEELGRLGDRDLAAVEPLLGDARQQSAQPPKPPMENPVPGMLARATRHQRAVEEGLSGLIDLLSQWGDAGALRGDARLLRDNVLREAAHADKLPEKVPAGKPPEKLPADQRVELDRAAGKLDRLADQSNTLLGRAAQLAGEKEKQADESHAEAKKKELEADELRKKAAAMPPATPPRNALEARAAILRQEAGERNTIGDRAKAEAAALRKAVENAGGQALPDDLRKSAEAMRANRQGESAAKDRSAAARLERLAASLAEQSNDDVPELAKKKKQLADELDEIAGLQDELRNRTADASRIKDDERRADELKKLAAEQQKLVDQTRDLVQRLQRDRDDDAAREARRAQDKMEAARDDLENGKDPENQQKDATDQLDAARDQLDSAAASAPQQLSDEKRRKLENLVKALHERQKAAVAEADRIQDKVLADKKWARPLLQSLKDLEDRERALGIEVRTLSEREFADLPVFQRLVKDAAEGIDKAAEKAKLRRQDALDADPDSAFDADLEKANASRVRRPMALAIRRLEQVLEVLKPDNAIAKKDKKKGPPPGGTEPMPPMPMGGGNGDVIPPLAQLKALRSLQAELNMQTAEFDKLHPDRDKLTEDDREELKELEAAQREIAALFEQMAKLFQMEEQE